MSKIDDLIREFCPDGVEYKAIKYLAEVGTGSSNGNEAQEDGEYPFFIRSQTVKRKNNWEYDEEAIIIPGEGGIGDIYHYVNGKYAIHQRVYRIHFIDNSVDVKFAFHYFRAFFKSFIMRKAVSATVKSIRKPMIEEFMIPVPPLEVQREIVRVLDSFTLLTAELTARKKQYSFYRDKMLNFGDKAPIYRLSELCESIADGDHMPPPKSDDGIPFITISNVTEYHDIDFENTMYVPESYYNSLAEKRRPRKGDILYTVVGSYGIPVCIENDKKFVFQRHIAILRPNNAIVKSRYLFHAMQSTDFKIQADKSAKGAAQKTIALSSLAKMHMPVPDMNVQERIVNVLATKIKLVAKT